MPTLQGMALAKALVAISAGASLGAMLRWYFGLKLNGLFPSIPPGTLVANLVGGYVVGIAVAYFAQAQDIAPEWRLLIITGFCGGLTTFSTFSAEVVSLLEHGAVLKALGAVAVHVIGSLAATIAGIASWQLVR